MILREMKTIVQLTIDNKYIREIRNRSVLDELGYDYMCVFKCSRGYKGHNTYKGYKFILKSEYNKSKMCEYRYILCIDINKNIIHKYKKLSDVEYNNFQFPLVSLCLNNKRVHHQGYIWVYSDQLEKIDEKIEKYKLTKGNNNKSKKKRICQYDGDKLIKTYSSVTEVESQGMFTRSCVSKCLTGRQKTHMGYRWEYLT